ncbi:hypothetical protein Tco_0713054 [Tanacetum coccineum]
MGETTFRLGYGFKAVIPIEGLIHIEQVAMVTEDENKNSRTLDLALIMHKNAASKAEVQGKLNPNWEGSYIIRYVNDNGSYLLTTSNGDDIPLAWHASNLKRCYI